jgi:Flp pilus assembly protein TadB
MTLWVLMALAPLLLVTMMALSHAFVVTLFTDPLGRTMLTLAAGLQIAGWFLLKRIIAIEV